MINIESFPEYRRGSLRKLIKEKPFLRVIEASNGLGGLIAENTTVIDAMGNAKGFDAMWLSGLCHAASKGKPDIELIDMSQKLSTIAEIMEVTSKPIILDGDTGGQLEHFCRHIVSLERMGVSAIVIEDKRGDKRNSLYGEKVLHELEEADVFANKIRRGKMAQQTNEFMIFARIESLIAGESVKEAMLRAEKYVQASADGIVIHSAGKDGIDIFEFAAQFKGKFPNVPLVFIPTTYNHFTDVQLHERGADLIIYANHLTRSAYKAMAKTAESILINGGSQYADENYCESVQSILNLIEGDLL